MKLTDIESGIEFTFNINEMRTMLRVKKTGYGECTEITTKLTQLRFYVKETPAEIMAMSRGECIQG
jgi:hypothetical protein